MSHRTRRLSVCACLSVLFACSQTAYSPPARFAPLRSIKPVGEEQMSLQGQFGRHGAAFGPAMVSGALRLNYGVDETTDLVVDGSWVSVITEPVEPTNPNIFAARVGFRTSGRHAALSVGGGGGYAPAGGPFLSFDVGGVIAYEHCRLVPFVSGGAFVSGPDPRPDRQDGCLANAVSVPAPGSHALPASPAYQPLRQSPFRPSNSGTRRSSRAVIA